MLNDFFKFLENKNRFIDANPNLTDDQKDILKNFFLKYPLKKQVLKEQPAVQYLDEQLLPDKENLITVVERLQQECRV